MPALGILVLIAPGVGAENVDFHGLRVAGPEGWRVERSAEEVRFVPAERVAEGEASIAVTAPRPRTRGDLAAFLDERLSEWVAGGRVTSRRSLFVRPLDGRPRARLEASFRREDGSRGFVAAVAVDFVGGAQILVLSASSQRAFEDRKGDFDRVVEGTVLAGPAPERVSIGGIRFVPPPGWDLDASSGVWSPRGGRPAGTFFVWAGPVEVGDAAPEGCFERFHPIVARSYDEVRAGRPATAASRSGVPIAFLHRELVEKGGERRTVLAVEAIAVAGGRAHFLLFGTIWKDLFVSLLRSEVDPMVLSVEPGEAPSPPPAPPVLGGPSRTIHRFGLALEVPASWTLDDGTPGHVFLFRVAGEEGDLPLLVAAELAIGRPTDRAAALRSWMLERLGVFAAGPDEAAARVPEGAALEETAEDWRFASGPAGTSRSIVVRRGAELERVLTGHLATGDEHGLFVGCAVLATAEVRALSDEARARLGDRLKTVVEASAIVAARSRFVLPPVQEEWTRWLGRKGSYRYFHESNTGGPSGFWVVSNRELRWTFHVDQTCELFQDRYFGMNDTHVDAYRPWVTTGFTWARRSQESASGRKRFEVRGTDDGDLWIVVLHPEGGSTLHRLEPAARRKWGVFEPEGLAIDGAIEGSYSVGDGYAVYEPWEK